MTTIDSTEPKLIEYICPECGFEHYIPTPQDVQPPAPLDTGVELDRIVEMFGVEVIEAFEALSEVDGDKAKNKVILALTSYIQERVDGKLLEVIGWIERNHLGKGFGGSDRWEHASAEIIDHIEVLRKASRGKKGKL